MTQFEPIDDLWIGLRDVNGKGNYQWSDGTPLDYTYFDIANVTAYPGKCIVTSPDRESAVDNDYDHWTPIPCEWIERAAICKKKPNF